MHHKKDLKRSWRKEVPKQEEEIKKMEEKLKLLNWKHQPVTGSTIHCDRPLTYVIYIVM